MKQVKLKFGIIFVETIKEALKRNDGFINVEDSSHKYLGRYDMSILSELMHHDPKAMQTEFDTYLPDLRDYKTPIDFSDWLDSKFVFTSKKAVEVFNKAVELGYFYDEDIKNVRANPKDKELLLELLSENDWINKIGEYFILVEN